MSSPDVAPPKDPASDSRRPKNSKFRQQNLPAWKPILTPATVLPTFFGFGVIFSIIGAILLVENNKVTEIEVDYTDCESSVLAGYTDNLTSGGPQVVNGVGTCADMLQSDGNYTDINALWNRCECSIDVDLSGFEGEPVYIYYGFENFYQNHRRYVESRSDDQLRSLELGGSEDCDPLNIAEDGRRFAPCGLIANSLYNDTIKMKNAAGVFLQTLEGNDISWGSDRKVKFINPKNNGTTASLCAAKEFNGAASCPPPNWPINGCQLGEEIEDCTGVTWCNSGSVEADNCQYNPWSSCYASSGKGYENEDLIVWMRTAALPTFRKLYRRVPNGLPDGKYTLAIGYNFPVKAFDGKKKIFISTTSVIGGKSNFLPGCYLAVGILCFVAGVGFLVMQSLVPPSREKLGSVANLAWRHEDGDN